MPAIEIWGPATWTLFHTLIEQLNEEAFIFVAPQMYAQFVKICRLLPCPECAQDATQFLAKINSSHIKSKIDFRNTFYLFHNWVNAKKRKPLFNYSNIQIYGKYNIIVVFNKFLSVYHTKGNMKMLNESFQRNLTVNSFKGWFTSVISAFMPSPPKPVEEVKPAVEESPTITEENAAILEETKEPVQEEPVIKEEPVIQEESIVQEEPVVEEEPVIKKEPVVEKEPVIKEEPVVEEESIVQEEPVVEEEPVIKEESIVQEEPVVEETSNQETIKEETTVEEEVLTLEKPIDEEEEVKPKGKKGRKPKK